MYDIQTTTEMTDFLRPCEFDPNRRIQRLFSFPEAHEVLATTADNAIIIWKYNPHGASAVLDCPDWVECVCARYVKAAADKGGSSVFPKMLEGSFETVQINKIMKPATIIFQDKEYDVDWIGQPSTASAGQDLSFVSIQPSPKGMVELSDGSRFENPVIGGGAAEEWERKQRGIIKGEDVYQDMLTESGGHKPGEDVDEPLESFGMTAVDGVFEGGAIAGGKDDKSSVELFSGGTDTEIVKWNQCNPQHKEFYQGET
jgi:hypothetical protein